MAESITLKQRRHHRHQIAAVHLSWLYEGDQSQLYRFLIRLIVDVVRPSSVVDNHAHDKKRKTKRLGQRWMWSSNGGRVRVPPREFEKRARARARVCTFSSETILRCNISSRCARLFFSLLLTWVFELTYEARAVSLSLSIFLLHPFASYHVPSVVDHDDSYHDLLLFPCPFCFAWVHSVCVYMCVTLLFWLRRLFAISHRSC